ncbi:hypothetical protein AnigIFM60653_002113 [Aspergillus niger]|nr:hypothetical protein AnigIFM50267_002619 [Aspergillus niger]GLA10236.1 hypothetical protein AnigIFM60653_002113 [Aspergillus niger]GLA44598.1 hypothetical protein AnigIFM63309_004219 [Aspergillus niger]
MPPLNGVQEKAGGEDPPRVPGFGSATRGVGENRARTPHRKSGSSGRVVVNKAWPRLQKISTTQYGWAASRVIRYSRVPQGVKKPRISIHAIALWRECEIVRPTAVTERYQPYAGAWRKMNVPCPRARASQPVQQNHDPAIDANLAEFKRTTHGFVSTVFRRAEEDLTNSLLDHSQYQHTAKGRRRNPDSGGYDNV